MSIQKTLEFVLQHPLNSDRRAASIIDFLKWQLGSRLLPGDKVFDWVAGARFYVRRGETGLTGNIYTGLHEFADMAYLLHVLRKEDIFVDVGANVGSYSLLAGAVIGARGFAFEPVPTTHRRLVENLRLNHIETRVNHPCLGMSDNPGKLLFTSDQDTVNHALTEHEKEVNVIEVKVSTLDDILTGEDPSFVKIDVEGFEMSVLRGATQLLARPSLHSVIMELNGSGQRYGVDESEILEMMLDNGFRTYEYSPFERLLVDLNGKNLDSGNTLFIRNKDFVEERIRTANHLTINGRTF
ncbi:FkbM family methyltransferase [Haliea sp. E17]|uniref:FkbM family methyltransferase n=1 Tax=Haliea sp. E17 TaxID=3401576 RepID=UPI003AAD7617